MPAPFSSVGDYLIIGELGAGGMGVVHEARHLRLNRTVALKVIRPEFAAHPEARRRFRLEAEAIAALAHPHIVPVYEVGEDGDQMFLAMGLVAGGSLAEAIAAGPLSLDRVVDWASKLAGAVDHAHQRGVLHRDLKPANVLLDAADEPHLADFGLAKLVESAGQASLSQGFLGTPAYLAPEVAGEGAKAATTASDVYALGVVLFEMLTGRLPFPPGSVLEILESVKTGRIPLPRTLRPEIPADLEIICLKCLRREPAQRYATAGEFGRDLERFRRREPIGARQPSITELLLFWARRNRTSATLSVALLASVAIGLGLVLFLWKRAEGALKNNRRLVGAQTRMAAETRMRDRPTEGLMYLASAIRQAPDDWRGSGYLLSELTQQNTLLAFARPLEHESEISQVRFSPDGRWVATASADSTARLWDVRTGRPSGRSVTHSAAVISVEFDASGSRLLSLSADGVIQVSGVPDGSRLASLAQPIGVVEARFLGSGREIVTASTHGAVRVIDAHTGVARVTLPSQGNFSSLPPGIVAPVAVSADGSMLATGGEHIRLWSAADGRLVRDLDAGASTIRAVFFAPGGSVLAAVAVGGTVRLWDLPSGDPRPSEIRHGSEILDLRFDRDGNRMVIASDDTTARVWEVRTGQALSPSLPHDREVNASALNPNGSLAVTGSQDGTVRVWDARTGAPWCIPVQQRLFVFDVDFSPDGTHVAACSGSGLAGIYDARTGRALPVEAAHNVSVTWAEFEPSGRRLVASCADGSIRFLDSSSGAEVGTISAHRSGVAVVRVSDDGSLIASASQDGTARVWDSATGSERAPPMVHDQPVLSVRMAANNRRCGTLTSNGTLYLWETELGNASRSLPQSLPGMTTSAGAFAFHPDNRTLVAGMRDGRFLRWDFAARTPPREIARRAVRTREVAPWVGACAVSSDGRFLAAGWFSGEVRVFTSQGERQLGVTGLHDAEVVFAAFSPDGSRLATGSMDQTVRIWEVGTGRMLTPPLIHRGFVRRIEFSSDGRRLLTASANGQVRIWDAEAGAPLGAGFEHAGYRGTRFSPDGQWVVTVGVSPGIRIWDTPAMDASPPDWLPALAEALAPHRFALNGAVEPAPPDALPELLRHLASLPGTDAFSRWGRWFVADRSTRTVSPFSAITGVQFTSAAIERDDADSLREAAFLDPTNAAVQARLRAQTRWRRRSNRLRPPTQSRNLQGPSRI